MKTILAFSLLVLLLTGKLAVAGEFPDDWILDQESAQRTAHAALEGKPMPALNVTNWINGGFTAGGIKGKVVLVDFYATWCVPCMQAIPHNNELLDKYRDQGFAIIGICSSDEGQESFLSNAREHGIKYPAATDPELKMEKAWAVKYYPTYVLIDRKGIVRVIGLRRAHIEEAVKKLLAESAP